MDKYTFNYLLKRKSGNASLNKGNEMISSNDRMHPIVKSTITKHLRTLSSSMCTNKGVFSETRPCEVLVKVYAPTNRRMDPPNWYPTVKALLDGLTDAEFWTDDNHNVIKRLIFEYGGLSGTKTYKIELQIKGV